MRNKSHAARTRVAEIVHFDCSIRKRYVSLKTETIIDGFM